MGGPASDDKALQDAVLNAANTQSPRPVETTNSARTVFYNRFQHQADEHDHDFVKKCGGDLDTTLIFAGLFSAVVSGFIAAIQTQLQPDYTQLSYDILWVIADDRGLKIPQKPKEDTAWSGPDPTLVRVQAILFSSLAVSLLAAFVAMLGKQWLNRYSQVDTHGSFIDRSRDRQRKMDGMATWHFNFIMESLPMMLQIALLLLGCALSTYLFTVDDVVAWVVASFTASGFLFYILIVCAATFSYNCPFQTPPSLFVHFMVRLDNRHRKYLRRLGRSCRHLFSRARKLRMPKLGGPYHFGNPGEPIGKTTNDHIELEMASAYGNLPTVFEKEIDWEGYELDSNCIAWMFKMSMDEAVVQDIMKFIPEVVWYNGIQTTPLKRLYDTVVECFDCSSDTPVVIPKLRNKAYLSAKALLHVAIHRKCVGNEHDTAAFESISRKHQNIGSRHYAGDSDLEYTLGMVDRVLGDGKVDPMRWDTFSFSGPHHAWMGRVLVYRSWDVLRRDGNLTDDIRQFVLYSLQMDPPPSVPIVTDCLLIVGLILGIGLDDDKHVTDKSQKLRSQIKRIYVKLVETFGNIDSKADEIDRALEVMRLIAPLSENDIAMKSYQLFHVIMQTPVSPAYSEEKKWEASRLALHGAYKWDKVLPWVDEPGDILDFLNHHFKLAAGGENQDVPIQNALRALAYAYSPKTIEALEHFDPTNPSFVQGICFAFQDQRPLKLRKAALFFLPLIADRWFNTSHPIMEPEEMKDLCTDWASALDELGLGAYEVQKVALAVLFDMINSSHWRPHIVPEKWDLLQYYTSVPEDSQPLKRCLGNLDLVDEISRAGGRDALAPWLAILWWKFKELDDGVRRQLVDATKGAQKWDFERYLMAIEREMNEAEDQLTEYNTWSNNPIANTLRARIDELKEAQDTLLSLRKG